MQGHAFVAGTGFHVGTKIPPGQPQVLRHYPTVVLLCPQAVLNHLQASMRAFFISFHWWELDRRRYDLLSDLNRSRVHD